MENYHMLFPVGSSASSSSPAMANHRSYLHANDSITATKAGNECEGLHAKDVCYQAEVKLGKKGDHKDVCDQGEVRVGKIGDNKAMRKHRYAFQTRSQVDILDDGYRWRKYGQKTVKNSKFPRSYYKCTHKDCKVKKQVQRSSKDGEIVVTTYEGTHTHPVEKFIENFEHLLRQMQTYNPL